MLVARSVTAKRTSLLAALTGVLALAGTAATTPARAGDTLTITNYGISGVSLPWAVAQEKGFIKQNGVEIIRAFM